jgi:hypothetical protein
MKNIETQSNQSIEIESLDDEWFSRFEEIGSFQAYEYFNGEAGARNTQKEAFLSGEIENPDLDYPLLDIETINNIESSLMRLKQDILEQETNEIVCNVYRWKINEKVAELRMMKSSHNGDMRRFERYSKYIYGKPSDEVFQYTIYNLNNKISKALDSDNPDIKVAAEILMQTLGELDIETTHPDISTPSDDTVELARVQTKREFNNILNIPLEDGKYDSNSIRNAFEEALRESNADGWEAIIVDNSTSISTNQEQKNVTIPESRVLPSKTRLQSLLVHEVGTHVARRVNGENTKLRLLSLGLDRYEQGEEGVATMREQVLKSSVNDFSGLEGHLAISLAMGLDGKKRDFRETYEVLEKYFYFKALGAKKSPEEALISAKNDAYKRCIRTFRGTDCKTKGVCFTKDMIYREGNIGVWDVIRNNPDEMTRFSVGKYDPSNSRYIYVLDQLGISDEDLITLDSEPQDQNPSLTPPSDLPTV